MGTPPTYYCLFSVMNKRYYNGRTNQSIINIVSLQFAFNDTNQAGTIYLIRDATLVGNPNFQEYDTSSCSLFDNTATTCTITNNRQIVWSNIISNIGQIDRVFDTDEVQITLQPGEMITVCGNTSASTAAIFAAALNTREDQ